jgi:hypothetical protein
MSALFGNREGALVLLRYPQSCSRHQRYKPARAAFQNMPYGLPRVNAELPGRLSPLHKVRACVKRVSHFLSYTSREESPRLFVIINIARRPKVDIFSTCVFNNIARLTVIF